MRTIKEPLSHLHAVQAERERQMIHSASTSLPAPARRDGHANPASIKPGPSMERQIVIQEKPCTYYSAGYPIDLAHRTILHNNPWKSRIGRHLARNLVEIMAFSNLTDALSSLHLVGA